MYTSFRQNLKMSLQAKPLNVNIVQFYSPTNAASEEIEDFYNILKEVIDDIANSDTKIIIGDASSKIGKSNAKTEKYGRYGLGECNDRGEIKVD